MSLALLLPSTETLTIDGSFPGGLLLYLEVGKGLDVTSSLETNFGARSSQIHQIREKTWEFCYHKTQKLGENPTFGVI